MLHELVPSRGRKWPKWAEEWRDSNLYTHEKLVQNQNSKLQKKKKKSEIGEIWETCLMGNKCSIMRGRRKMFYVSTHPVNIRICQFLNLIGCIHRRSMEWKMTNYRQMLAKWWHINTYYTLLPEWESSDWEKKGIFRLGIFRFPNWNNRFVKDGWIPIPISQSPRITENGFLFDENNLGKNVSTQCILWKTIISIPSP